MTLASALGVQYQQDPIIAAVGAGGKTSCLYQLAHEFKQQGARVLLTTTTKIVRPNTTEVDYLIESRRIKPALLPQHPGTVTVLGAPCQNDNNKLAGIDPGLPAHLIEEELFDAVLVEADGSRHRPLKAPNSNEPVIPDSCQRIIGVCGWQGMKSPLRTEHVQRWAEFTQLTGLKPGDRLTTTALTTLLNAPNGLFQYCATDSRKVWLINQVDDDQDQFYASELARSVLPHIPAVERIVLTSLAQKKSPLVITGKE